MITAPCIISLRGEFDIYNRAALEDALLPAYNAPNVVIDFSNVRYMDSTALAVLVRKRRRRAELGYPPAAFAGMSSNLAHILRISGLQDLWPACETLDEAISHFEDHR
jgi:anti-anti-sigma factor